jgi:small-conductance mechanosensitive channel
MSLAQKIGASALLVLLLLTGYGLWSTNDPSGAPVQRRSATVVVGSGTNTVPVIDQRTLLVAQRLARYADTPEEQALAKQAVETADHELDLAFAAALHHVEAHPPPLSPEAERIQQHLEALQKALAADTDEVKALTAQLAKASDADKPALQDRLDLAQAQASLEQDEIDQANEELLQAGGNVHQLIQTMQKEHEAAQHAAAPAAPAAPIGALADLKGMVGEFRQWLALRRKERWLSWAREHVVASAEQLSAERQKIAAELQASKALIPEYTARAHGARPPAAAANGTPAAPGKAPPAAAAPAARAPSSTASAAAAPAAARPPPATLLELTRQIAAEQQRLILRDERISARQHLADLYSKWNDVVASEGRAVLHEWLGGACIVLLALLVLLFLDSWLERLVARTHIDRRQMQTLRSVVGVSLQLIGVVVILVMLIGLPGQIGTLLGIIGAGLTVALKDFIVAFIGWFVLMGRNGMRLGDWVEINGVSGEVIELNMFHTVLLETGNWTDPGHPTGRRVTFTNSFAISGHYFNFSTSGQWLWDELSVIVPYDRDPHAIADSLHKEVTAATAGFAREAEAEWKRVARGRGTFTAQPGIAIRPSAAGSGVEIAVRYVTRASERVALRSRLYQTAVQLLATHGPATGESSESGARSTGTR